MKMIKPIVNLSKVIDAYDAVVCGFNGVLHNGVAFIPEAMETLIELYRQGKKIVLISNSAMRVEELCRLFHQAGYSPKLFTAMVTAGEVLHYRLPSFGLQKNYFNLGDQNAESVFDDLKYTKVSDLNKADFVYIGNLPDGNGVDVYLDDLHHAVSLGLPLVCVGNDTSALWGDDVVSAAGALAEQYAVLGGKIMTTGKPDAKIVEYTLGALADIERKKILFIGDSIPTDIKAAGQIGLSSCLITRGIHTNYLGEGYIPDVGKTRELGNMLEAYPDYVISKLRW